MAETTVVLTDFPWKNSKVEREILEAAGLTLVTGEPEAGSVEKIDALIAGCDPTAVITCWAPVSAAAIRNAPRLKIIARMGVGLDNIDVAEATRSGTLVTNVPDYCAAEVSDHAIALLLNHFRCVTASDNAVKRKGWHVSDLVPRRLKDLTVGVIGFGRIGRETVRKLEAFGFNILVADHNGVALPSGIERVTLPEMAERADALILHAPLTADTVGMIGATFLGRCARQPLVINVSRGGLIDNDALLSALQSGKISGAALDVVDGEPAPPPELITRPDVIVTPHIAYLSEGSLIELRRRACEEVVRVLTGQSAEHPCNEPHHVA